MNNSILNDDAQLLDRLSVMVTDINGINGSNEKVERLSKFSDLKPFLQLLMDPLRTTGVTSKQIQKREMATTTITTQKTLSSSSTRPPPKKKLKVQPTVDSQMTVCELLQQLYDRLLSGHQAQDTVIHFLQRFPQHRNLLLCIIDQDLQIRMNTKQINKAFPNLINEFSVSLAEDFQKHQNSFEQSLTQGQTWWVSRKYDGIRCIVICREGDVKVMSRNGNRLPALKSLESLLTAHCVGKPDFVLDGEICVVDSNGQDVFAEAVSQAKRKSVVMEQFRFYTFDMLTKQEFDQGTSVRLFSLRQGDLKSFVNQVNDGRLKLVTQHKYDPESWADLLKQSEHENWEGLMLRLDAPYKGRRSNELLKAKKFQTAEYKVLDVDTGPMRIIDQDSGLETTIQTMRSVSIEHKNNEVHVGSGFSLADRHKYFQHPEQIRGKVIAVKYFEETQDKTGKYSLRFPTFVHLYGDQRDV